MSIEYKGVSNEWRLYMYLLKCAIRGIDIDEKELSLFDDIDSDKLIQRARNNSQTMLLADNIYRYALYRKEEKPVKINAVRQTIMIYEKYKQIRHILELAKQNELLIVIFKGCVLANLYPQYVLRSSSDTDIFVYDEDKERAVKLFTDDGYIINEKKSNDEVCVMYHEVNGHKIELHTCLWEDYEGKKLEILKSFNLTDKETLIEMNVCGFSVTTLGYQEHLIYQLFHIIKHFSLEGVGMKYLVDIALYVDAYGEYINYESLWSKLERIGYAKFAHYLFAICIEFLGMNRDILAGRNMEMGEELAEFINDLFQKGSIYEGSHDSWQILGMMTPYFTGEKKGAKHKLTRKLAVVFPKPKDLPNNYSYAKKVPVLLPVAWVHKAVNYLIKYYSRRDKWYSANEKLDIAEHRIDLMNKMGLLK